jgi:hypothetical protein
MDKVKDRKKTVKRPIKTGPGYDDTRTGQDQDKERTTAQDKDRTGTGH